MNLSNIRKILIIRLSSLGDILLTTPLIRAIKEKYPSIEIDFLLRKEYLDTVKYNSRLSNILTIERDYQNHIVRSKIKKTDYDLIIDLQNNLRSRRLSFNASRKIIRYNKPYLDRYLLVKFKINRFKKIIPIPERYARAIPGFQLDNKGPELITTEINSFKPNQEITYIGFCPGSRHKTKMWPENYFVELGNKLTEFGYGILLFGGKDDREVCKSISNKVNGSLDLSNDNDLLNLAANMKICKAMVCNDSGLMHTATAVNIPVVAIFGSTVKEFGFTPYKSINLILENNSLTCRPCSHIGLDDCPKNHLNCMNKITPEVVLEKTLEFVENL